MYFFFNLTSSQGTFLSLFSDEQGLELFSIAVDEELEFI